MIEKKIVESLVEEWLTDKDYFLVDVEVTPDDRIVVEIDHAEGVWIDDCVSLSRFIEDHLDRDEEDYELLTEMSGVKGCLKHLDLSGVTESFPGPDDWRFFFIGNEDLAIYPDSFVNMLNF